VGDSVGNSVSATVGANVGVVLGSIVVGSAVRTTGRLVGTLRSDGLRRVGKSVSAKVGTSEGALLGSIVVGDDVRGLRSKGAAVAHCGSATRASIVTLASDFRDDLRRWNDSRRPTGTVVVVVVVHAAIDARRRVARVRGGHDDPSIEDRR